MSFIKHRKYQVMGLWLLICLVKVSVEAQSIRLHLPFYAQKEAALLVQNGVEKDTVSKIRLSSEGKATFPTKDILKRTGLVFVSFGSGNSFSFIATPQETISLASTEATLSVQTVRLTGAVENSLLEHWFRRKVFFQQSINGLNTLLALYEPKSNFHSTLLQEKSSIEGQQRLYSDTLKASRTFAAGYIQIRDSYDAFFAKGYPSASVQASMRQYFLDSLDIELLYGSNIWADVFNGSMSIYGKGGVYADRFGEDMVILMNKTHADDVFTALADIAISMCEKYSLTKDEDVIVNYLVGSSRLPHPKGKLKKLLQLKSTQVGSKAPDLVIVQNEGEIAKKEAKSVLFKTAELSSKYTLLLFHETGCSNCEVAIEDLKRNYDYLYKKGMRVISFAADTDESKFKNTIGYLPWKEAYCDYKGFSGENFSNYAIMATPTMFVLNNKGIIQAKLASVPELIEWIK